ncbi:peroxiredoxin family protein [Thermophagus sp. OGC60D27]|uniref:peroxiredoxin family protein n=1 Tax=Thermophagus sp. OGC60D27 TaxID=3458415 RepID=UPI004037B263
MNKRIKLSGLLLVSLLFVTACNSGKSSENKKAASSTHANMKKAPLFEVETIDGQKISLQQSLDEQKPTIVYFTASWCPMCAKNWPAISEVYPEYQDRVNFVAISIDPTDDKEVLTKLAREKNLNFPLVTGMPKLMMEFGVKTQATTVGVNKEGYVEFQKDKTVLTADEYRALFEQLLK